MAPYPLRTVHVGLGERGRAFLDAADTGLLEPVALVDPDPDVQRYAASRAGIPEDCCREELADGLAADADAALIAVPLSERLDAVMAALAADLHVLVSAPPAADPADAARCVFISQNRGVKLMVAPAGADPRELARQLHGWVMDGVEPATSARRWLASLP